jgi:hypothetical protein
MFYSQKRFFIILSLVIFSFSLLPTWLGLPSITPGFTFSLLIAISITLLFKLLDKIYEVSFFEKLQYIFIGFLFGYTVYIVIILFAYFVGFGLFSLTMILIILIYFVQLHFVLKFDEYPLLRSNFETKSGYDYQITLLWLLYSFFIIFVSLLFYIALYGFDLLNIGLLISLTIIVLYLSLLILNQIFWEPKFGFVIPKPKKPLDIDNVTLENLLKLGESNQISPEEYYQGLWQFKNEMIKERTNLEKILIIQSIIHTSNFFGQAGKAGKVFIFLLLPTLLERWRIFALLPKHLQKISHNFLEMLYLTNSLTDHWFDILNHEISYRITAKQRFDIVSDSPIPSQNWNDPFHLFWDGKVFMGKRGFYLSQNALKRRGLIGEKQSSGFFGDLEWENDLEVASINVFKTFFGYGSRGAWGKSAEKGSYDKHQFVVQGNLLKNFYNRKIEPSSTPLQLSLEGLREEELEELIDVDESYIDKYLATGEFPVINKKNSPVIQRIITYLKSPRTRKVILYHLKVVFYLTLILGILWLLNTYQPIFDYKSVGVFFYLIYIVLLGSSLQKTQWSQTSNYMFSGYTGGPTSVRGVKYDEQINLSELQTDERIFLIIITLGYIFLVNILL